MSLEYVKFPRNFSEIDLNFLLCGLLTTGYLTPLISHAPYFFSYPSSACIFSALSSFFPIFFKDFTFACLTHPQGKVNGRGWQDYGTAGLQDCGTGSQCAICPSISPNTRCQSDVNPPLKPAAPGKGNTQSSLPNNPYKVPFLQRTGAYTKGGGRGRGGDRVAGCRWPFDCRLGTGNCELRTVGQL